MTKRIIKKEKKCKKNVKMKPILCQSGCKKKKEAKEEIGICHTDVWCEKCYGDFDLFDL